MELRIAPTYDYLYNLFNDIRDGNKLRYKNINLAGGRHCYKTSSYIIFCWLAVILFPGKRFTFYMVRKSVQNRIESYKEILKWMPTDFIPPVITNQTDKMITGDNFIFHTLGLQQHKGKLITEKLGLTRHNVDYTFICFDEAWQFTPQDLENVLMAVGGYKELAIFKCANPYKPSSKYFKDFHKHLPFEMSVMKEKGELIKYEPVDKTIWHWTNFIRAMKDNLLSDDTIKLINDADRDDPLMGEVVKYGKPALLQGGIYDVRQIIPMNEKSAYNLFQTGKILIGVDFGYSTDATAVSINVIDGERKRLLLLRELVIDNKRKLFDLILYTRLIINFIYETLLAYKVEHHSHVVYCEKDFAWVDTLNRSFAHVYPKCDVFFDQVGKNFKDKNNSTRIRCFVRLISSGMMFAVIKSVPVTLEQLESSVWEMDGKDQNTLRRLAGNDHSLDAMEYSCYEYLHELGVI